MGDLLAYIQSISAALSALFAFLTVNSWRKQKYYSERISILNEIMISIYKIVSSIEDSRAISFSKNNSEANKDSQLEGRFLILESASNKVYSINEMRPMLLAYFKGARQIGRLYDEIQEILNIYEKIHYSFVALIDLNNNKLIDLEELRYFSDYDEMKKYCYTTKYDNIGEDIRARERVILDICTKLIDAR
ncbi:hypothetical protein C8N35_10359 [Breoghania corrubedonensis]|uniref:EF-hand domain-containing protein n=1 Tax=Breoghania corrubedonensis TaxID=665038 RepID=A0A2T5VAV7_9HYPH|nr:hypothetical protein [Breoghania corrubedonensis]PTW60880.1 hypothetical protein C8N35_10359 [Breoghania corrubedonensis]